MAGGRMRRLRRLLAPTYDGTRDGLVRSADRVEAWACVVLLVLGALAVSGAVRVGQLRYADARAAILAQAAASYPATATVVASERIEVPSPTVAGGGLSWVTVQWRDPAGAPLTDRLAMPARPRPGDSVKVWASADGRATMKPPDPAAATIDGMATGGIVLVGALALLGAAYGGVLTLLGRRREALWAQEWAAVEPGWRREVL